MQFLESRLIALARAAKRARLDNATQPAEPSLSEADRADMEVFLAHMLGMLPVLGVQAFEQARQQAEVAKVPSAASLPVAPAVGIPDSPALTELFCSGKGFKARGSDTTQGFVVFAGSGAAAVGGASMTGSGDRFRRDLLEAGVLKPDGDFLRFTQDYVFSSPSQAAGLVLGRASNGRIEWKDAQGRTLKELQAAEAAQ